MSVKRQPFWLIVSDDLHQYSHDILLAARAGFVYKSNACLIYAHEQNWQK
jgi:hypothetical protein